MKNDLILLGHGSGGKLSHQLLDQLIIPTLSNIPSSGQNDAAVLTLGNQKIAMTTDSFVVDPIFFPGGNIGDLAVNGTVNDLAMVGAIPASLSVGLILEEGFSRSDLGIILQSMRKAADLAGVKMVTGDTKVVPRGKVDRIFINTTGIGLIPEDRDFGGANARRGDKILINGTIGDHGMAIMSCREGLSLETTIHSDCAALNGLIEKILEAAPGQVHVMRDPTRGGVATTLKEIALQSGITMTLDEEALPTQDAVRGICSLLGLDPLYVANEGKVLIVASADSADKILQIMRRHPLGEHAAIIGEVTGTDSGRVQIKTSVGGHREVDMLSGDQLPRIC